MDDLRQRLRRLGVVTGREFRSLPHTRQGGPELESLVEGQVIQTEVGPCFRVRHVYEPDAVYGTVTLSEWVTQDVETLALIGEEPELARIGPCDFVLLDTETTGLGGGDLAFVVGIGLFDSAGRLEVQQFFLRDPSEEPAMLALVEELLQANAGLVTFNGRAFDVPLLAGRYVMARKQSCIASLPDLDLLHPARRLWRRRLASCALRALEEHVLGVRRTADDVPGYLIPALYRQYLATHDARQMPRVLYHNEMDLLAMVALGVVLCRTFGQPEGAIPYIDDRLSLARWYAGRGMLVEAETAYRSAIDEAPDAESRYEALIGLAYLLKRAGRREEAALLWADVADLRLDTLGHEELAKYHEWHNGNPAEALRWTEQAIRLAESWRPGWRRTQTLSSLYHRRDRLLRRCVALHVTPDRQLLEE